MFDILKKSQSSVDAKATIDSIEAYVYERVKPMGFRKFGRTLHRFVSEDISQVIHFQHHEGQLCVNIGIRVPECDERGDEPEKERRTYYREYECSLRTRLGVVSSRREAWYDLKKDAQKTAERIWREIEQCVLPVFDLLNSRERILAHRRQYPHFDTMNDHMILLEEALIYRHLGDRENAIRSFNAYYRKTVDEYNEKKQAGTKYFLRKGETLVYMDQTVTAKKNQTVTLYDADDRHIQYLIELAQKLDIPITEEVL